MALFTSIPEAVPTQSAVEQGPQLAKRLKFPGSGVGRVKKVEDDEPHRPQTPQPTSGMSSLFSSFSPLHPWQVPGPSPAPSPGFDQHYIRDQLTERWYTYRTRY